MNKFKNITTSLFLIVGILIATFLGMIAINPKQKITNSWTDYYYNDGIISMKLSINGEKEAYQIDFTSNEIYPTYQTYSLGNNYYQNYIIGDLLDVTGEYFYHSYDNESSSKLIINNYYVDYDLSNTYHPTEQHSGTVFTIYGNTETIVIS